MLPGQKPEKQKKKPGEKPRDDWYFRRSTYPLRDAAPAELEKFWENQQLYPRASNAVWQEAGPANYAGRVTTLAVDPADSTHILAGTGGGGLWRTSDRGLSWHSIWPKFVSQSIGAVAFHPRDRKTIICATGEGNLSPVYPGSGIYVSRDAGFTWRPFVDASRPFPRRVTTIAFGPAPGRRDVRIAFGSSTKDPTLHAGLFLSQPGGSFDYVPITGHRSYNCYDIAFHPTDPEIIFCSIEPRGTLNGIWRSRDAGLTWHRLAGGLPPGELCGRISLAISPSHPQILYAFIATPRVINGVLGVYRSADGGDTWELSNPPNNLNERQLNYNNVIAVHPTDPKYAVCGGTLLHQTRDGGKTWKPITTGSRLVQNPATGKFEFPPNSVHLDQHAIRILPGGWIYSGNDGGFALSHDDGATWEERPNGMVTTMFYDLDVAPGNSAVFGGGAQDAGSLISGVLDNGQLAPAGSDPRQYLRVLPGDGGWMVFDSEDPTRIMSTAGATLYRHLPGAPFASRTNPGNHSQLALSSNDAGGWVTLNDLNLPPQESKLRAFTIVAFQPPGPKTKKRLWFATNRLRYSEDFGNHWHVSAPNFDGSAVSALEFASAQPGLIFAGTSNGGIFRSRDNGRRWTANLAGAAVPCRLITQIEVHPADPQVVVVTTASTGAPAAALNARATPFGHVFRSLDGGDTWIDIDRGALPNVVYNGLAFETHPPYRIFVGGDAGVWVFQHERWMSVTGSLPNVVVSDLVYHPDGILTAATYGRGIWRLPLPKGEPFHEEPRLTQAPAQQTPLPISGYVLELLVAPPVPRPAEFHAKPRAGYTLAWSAVPGALGYVVETRSAGRPPEIRSTKSARLKIPGVPPGPVTWQVWALLPGFRCTRSSRRARAAYHSNGVNSSG